MFKLNIKVVEDKSEIKTGMYVATPKGSKDQCVILITSEFPSSMDVIYLCQDVDIPFKYSDLDYFLCHYDIVNEVKTMQVEI